MPATEKNWRDLKMMHVVFAISAFALLGTTLWMMAADHEDQWRGFQNAFAQIEQALRSEYVIAYQPADLKPDGSFRPVEILPMKSKLQVRARRGYYSPRESAASPF